MIDVPQSVTVVTSELIQRPDDDERRRRHALRRRRCTRGENNRDQVIIRGNSSSADFFVDGVRDDVQYHRDLYNLDRVEALKGPNAMIFGRGGARCGQPCRARLASRRRSRCRPDVRQQARDGGLLEPPATRRRCGWTACYNWTASVISWASGGRAPPTADCRQPDQEGDLRYIPRTRGPRIAAARRSRVCRPRCPPRPFTAIRT